MSSRVCRPLKRAKSTVGDPLSRGTELLLASMASIDWMVALNETTLASGASVPMTNADPEVVPGLETELPDCMPQPARRKTASRRGAALRQRAAIAERMRAWVDIERSRFPRFRGSRVAHARVAGRRSRPGHRGSVRAEARELDAARLRSEAGRV